MRMRHAAAVAGLALGLMSGTAKAAVIEYTSQTAFDAAVPNSDAQTFSGIPAPVPSYTAGPLTITTSSGSVSVYSGGDYNGQGSAYLGTAGGANLIVSSNQNVTALGLTIGTYFGADTVSVVLNGMTLVPVLTPDKPGTSFVGFTSDSPISSVVLHATAGSETDLIRVQYATSPVPLPASAPMFGGALLAIGAIGFGVKRKKAAASA